MACSSRWACSAWEQETARGAAHFLDVSERVLADPANVLWDHGGGALHRPAAAPPSGCGPGWHILARRMPGATILPLAIEYSFWNESRPEALARFGDPIEAGGGRGVADWTAYLEAALAQTMDALTAESARRDPALFRPLVRGGAGVGGIYGRVAAAAGLGGRAAVRPLGMKARNDGRPGVGLGQPGPRGGPAWHDAGQPAALPGPRPRCPPALACLRSAC